MSFGYRIFLVWSSYVDFYVLWSRGDDGQSCCVTMGRLMSTGFGPVWSDPVWTWPVCSGRCGGRRGVVGGRGRSAWAEHGPVRDDSSRCLLPMIEDGGDWQHARATVLVS